LAQLLENTTKIMVTNSLKGSDEQINLETFYEKTFQTDVI